MLFRWLPSAGALACLLLASADIRAQSGPIRIEDDAGRVLVLEATPQRIVSLVPVATEILFSLGEGTRLVGRSRFDFYPPEARSIPDVGDALLSSLRTIKWPRAIS